MSLTCLWHMLQTKNRPWALKMGKSIKWQKPASCQGCGQPLDSHGDQMSWICWDGPNLKHSSLLSHKCLYTCQTVCPSLGFGIYSYHMDTRYPSIRQTQCQSHGGDKRTDIGARWILGQPAQPLTIYVALGSFHSF